MDDHPQPARMPGAAAGRRQTRTALESFNWNLAGRCIYDIIVSPGSFIFVGFALSLGIARESIGILAALFSIAGIFQIVSLGILRHIRNKKRFVLFGSLAEPLLMIGVILLVGWLAPGWRITVLAAALFIAAGIKNAVTPMSTEWLASSIPESIRGRYLGRRVQLQNLVLIITTLAAGCLADRLEISCPLGLKWILVAAGVIGMAAVFPLRKAVLPQISKAARVHWRDWQALARHRLFWRYAIGLLILDLPFWLAVPYYQVFNISVLQLSKITIAGLLILYYLCSVLLGSFWGRKADRYQPRAILAVLMPLYIGFFFCFPLSTLLGVWAMILGWGLVGIADSAFTVANQALLYGLLPNTPNRPAFIAVANLITLGSQAAGALAAVPILNALKGSGWTLGPWRFGQFQIFFLGITAFMIVCSVSAWIFPKISKRSGNQA